MKKFLTALLGAIVFVASAFGLAACDGASDGPITVYMPDGAPALAVAQLMYYEAGFGKEVKYTVVSSDEITSCVTYEDESDNADLCILPVNAASKLLGTGEKYRMLGTVTHGNLYIVAAKDKDELTQDNFAENLSGKKVGVATISGFPGSVTKLLLSKYNITDEVTLEGVNATQVTGTESEFDYFVVPEPAASTRTGAAANNLKIVGDMQELYGTDGYPQAVLVAKKSLIQSDPDFIASFCLGMQGAAEWLVSDYVTAQTIIDAISAHYADPVNTKPAFSAADLSKTVIENCAVNFTYSADCYTEVNSFLTALKAAGDAASTAVSETFYYIPQNG